MNEYISRSKDDVIRRKKDRREMVWRMESKNENEIINNQILNIVIPPYDFIYEFNKTNYYVQFSDKGVKESEGRKNESKDLTVIRIDIQDDAVFKKYAKMGKGIANNYEDRKKEYENKLHYPTPKNVSQSKTQPFIDYDNMKFYEKFTGTHKVKYNLTGQPEEIIPGDLKLKKTNILDSMTDIDYINPDFNTGDIIAQYNQKNPNAQYFKEVAAEEEPHTIPTTLADFTYNLKGTDYLIYFTVTGDVIRVDAYLKYSSSTQYDVDKKRVAEFGPDSLFALYTADYKVTFKHPLGGVASPDYTAPHSEIMKYKKLTVYNPELTSPDKRPSIADAPVQPIIQAYLKSGKTFTGVTFQGYTDPEFIVLLIKDDKGVVWPYIYWYGDFGKVKAHEDPGVVPGKVDYYDMTASDMGDTYMKNLKDRREKSKDPTQSQQFTETLTREDIKAKIQNKTPVKTMTGFDENSFEGYFAKDYYRANIMKYNPNTQKYEKKENVSYEEAAGEYSDENVTGTTTTQMPANQKYWYSAPAFPPSVINAEFKGDEFAIPTGFKDGFNKQEFDSNIRLILEYMQESYSQNVKLIIYGDTDTVPSKKYGNGPLSKLRADEAKRYLTDKKKWGNDLALDPARISQTLGRGQTEAEKVYAAHKNDPKIDKTGKEDPAFRRIVIDYVGQ